MQRYITVEDALNSMCDSCDAKHAICAHCPCKHYEAVECTPSADVRENIHGRWIVDEDGNLECSVCGHHGVGDLYCERCGARMDESEGPTMEEYMYGQEGSEEDGSL